MSYLAKHIQQNASRSPPVMTTRGTLENLLSLDRRHQG